MSASVMIAAVLSNFVCAGVLSVSHYSLRAGPHPHALSLGDFAPRSGRRRFTSPPSQAGAR
jgi:hypothetical protein